jgi:undecaprenyl-diphosphatase
MDSLQIVVLAIVQGITEFLPISSSGHLILVPYLTNWPDQGLEFDVAVHVGTLSAIVIYFRRTLWEMARDWLHSVLERRPIGQSRLAWAVLLGTIPAGLTGLLLRQQIETTLRSPWVVACTTIGFALLLWAADRRAGQRSEREVDWLDALSIGCAQALALVPGTSRSGVTITAGLFRGLSREAAARFSFLLAVPVMTAAGLEKFISYSGRPGDLDTHAIVLGAGLSALTGLACIHFFLKWLTRFGLLPYVIYRLALGAVLLIFVL